MRHGRLAVIVGIVAAVLLIPVGAWSVLTFTNVAITDPGGTDQVRVDASGSLQAAQTAPRTGAVSAGAFSIAKGTCASALTVPTGPDYVVTMLKFSSSNTPAPAPVVTWQIKRGAAIIPVDGTLLNAGSQTTVVPLPSGVRAVAGDVVRFCNTGISNAALSVYLTVNYYVDLPPVPTTTTTTTTVPDTTTTTEPIPVTTTTSTTLPPQTSSTTAPQS